MAVAELQAETLLTIQEESQLTIVWRRFRKHKLAVAGGLVVIFFILATLAAGVLAPYDPLAISKNAQGQIVKNGPISAEHLMGTDTIGRDVFSRLLYAGRISLFVAFSVVLVSESFGAFMGAVSGYYGGRIDDLIQRVVEFMLTLPLLPLLLALSSLLRSVEVPYLPPEWSSAVVVTVILIIFSWMGATRLVRGMVLAERAKDYSEAARAVGMSDLRIIVRHMLPNALAPLIVNATLGLGGVIILESALSFLGFGIQLPIATWGNMLNEYQNDMWTQPAKVFFPGLAIFVCSLSFNYIGDGLRDALDPRLKM